MEGQTVPPLAGPDGRRGGVAQKNRNMSALIYHILDRRVGESGRAAGIPGWMAYVKGWGSPNGLRNFWFEQWAKDTFCKTKHGALKRFRESWSGDNWVLIAVKPVRLVKATLGQNDPVNLDTMCEFPIRPRLYAPKN